MDYNLPSSKLRYTVIICQTIKYQIEANHYEKNKKTHCFTVRTMLISN